MSVKIRLSRHGSKKRPFYWIVVANSSSPRDGRFIEKIGIYNPLLSSDNAKRVIVDKERAIYWLGQGAQPTEKVNLFLSKLRLVPKRHRFNPKKGKLKDIPRFFSDEQDNMVAEEFILSKKSQNSDN